MDKSVCKNSKKMILQVPIISNISPFRNRSAYDNFFKEILCNTSLKEILNNGIFAHFSRTLPRIHNSQ